MQFTLRNLITCSALLFSSVSVADSSYRPYADLTINAYWDSQYQDMEPMDLTKVSEASGIKAYHLAFITDAGSCLPAWGAQSSYSVKEAWGKHLTDKMQNASINYIISFGGASGNDMSLACSDEQLHSVYETVITTYNPLGLDFDIENGTANVSKIMNTLKQIQTAHPKLKLSFTLPVMPEGLTAQGQDIVKQAEEAHLSYTVNIMAMDYGPAYNDDMGQYAIQAASSLFTFLKTLHTDKTDAAIWNMIEVTPMIGVNDVNSEQFTLQDADLLRTFAQQKQLGGIAMWSVARDKPCADKWASPVCSGNNLQTTAHEFSQRFFR